MLFAYVPGPRGLKLLPPGEDISKARWVDLYRPLDAQSAAVTGLGLEVPSLADMEEIEISNRLYREEKADYMTVVLPGLSMTKTAMSGPVTFILTPERLVTVRHHAPRPFETFPERCERSAAGTGSPERLFLGLIEEIVSRMADLLEGAGRALDGVSGAVLSGAGQKSEQLQAALEEIGRQGELLGRVRLSLLTLERALSFFGQTLTGRPESEELKELLKGEMRDIQALSVHGDFLSSRVSLALDATMGMVNLAQNATVRILSVVAALFLPPTLIASIYGMNFRVMPELDWSWGYPGALLLMVASAVATWAFFKWRGWL